MAVLIGWLSSPPQVGDWVRLTRPCPLTLTDHLLGRYAGLATGTRGVVTDRRGRRVQVNVDTGWGAATHWLPADRLTVVRRRGGIDAFTRRTATLTIARLAVATALLLPVLHFTARYLWQHRSADGIIEAFVLASLYGIHDSLAAALHQPARALLYLAVVTALSRFAFGRRH